MPSRAGGALAARTGCTPPAAVGAASLCHTGVTNPSRKPEASQENRASTPLEMLLRAAFPSLERHGTQHKQQKILSPAATEINTAVSSGRTMRKMKAEEVATR